MNETAPTEERAEAVLAKTGIGRFTDRRAAGRELGEQLRPLAGEDPVVFGLPRGGVPVAYEVAQALGAPLDLLIVRKVGAPGNPELGVGAVAEGGTRALNQDIIRELLISTEELDRAVARAVGEVEARVLRYRPGRQPVDVAGRTAIVVDDGLATGATARAALRAIRVRGPRRLVLAVPVGSRDVVESLRAEADEVVCLLELERLRAVGFWYEHFDQTADAEIENLLADDPDDPDDPPPKPFTVRTEVRIPAIARVELVGDLAVPRSPRGLVLFAHGSGSSHRSPRNRQVAQTLNERQFATLLLDLLTPAEELDRANVFDIAMLAERLIVATRWAWHEPLLASLPTGYFGASTGAGAALWAAAELDGQIGAVVSRGGRPDLAYERLPHVTAPVLLIVGGHDEVVLDLNQDARTLLAAPSDLAVVPGASHLFEEPGALEQVSQLAGNWFEWHLSVAREQSA